MSRDLPETLQVAIGEKVVRPFMAIYIDLPDVVRAWTGVGTLTFPDSNGDAQEWQGAGGVGAIDTVGESRDGSATNIKVAMFNVPSEFRDDIADQAVRGATFEIYVGALELGSDWHSVIATKMLWRGRVDDYRITDSGDTITVEITGESRAIDQRRPAIKRFSDDFQQRRYPGDLFFAYLPRMTEIPILWAQAEQSGAAGAGPGGRDGPRLNFDAPF